MTDVFSREKRSEIMAAVRSRGNKNTEQKLISILQAYGIKGWRRNQSLTGNPDFMFRHHRLAVFVDGCFWHGCRLHLRMPQSNMEYWRNKIAGNMARDRAINHRLAVMGYRVLRIWEHSLQRPDFVAKRINAVLNSNF
jgi:DNA mismatch endonuclease, patch repair protein